MPSEFELIARHFAPMAGPGGLGLLDDAAILSPPRGCDLVVTSDAIVAGVHFFADDPADTIGRKALGVNLSDLSAKGATPLGFLLSLVAPKELTDAWLAAFSAGLGALASEAGCPLLGGDTVTSPGPLTLSITAFGCVPAGSMTRRGGAKPGDRLFVTGSIGDGAVGLKARLAERNRSPWRLGADHLDYLRDRYLSPRPRVAAAEAVRSFAHGAMDVSDGFVGDLRKMLGLAGLGAEVWIDEIPLSVAVRAAIRRDASLLDTALTGGDDYEILAAVAPEKARAFQDACLAAGVLVTCCGVATEAGGPVRFLESSGEEHAFPRGSFVHGEA
jgi:thiamine-monophosphate kinase